jgi:leucyl-tRNA synthetase
MTVLANDQVVEGKCERCKSEITQKKHPQWFIKITAYADRLIQDLDLVDRPEETKTAQKNWIGRSEWTEIDFVVKDTDTKITCFTTRIDTVYGVTAVVLAPENPILDDVLSDIKRKEVEIYRQETLAKTAVQRQKDLKDKTWVQSGIFVIHPLTGEEIEVWYADYVLADYGSGAVMMVPAHDERDWEFAKKFAIEIKQVIAADMVLWWDCTPRDDVETLHRDVINAIIENEKWEILMMKDTHWHFVW